ncbi:MAG: regulatory iron-sulfur-containing complex subunit RicT [Saprospiraceae bacterium]
MSEELWNLPKIENQTETEKVKFKKFEKLSTFDYLSLNNVWDVTEFDIYEISFKEGSRKEFYKNTNKISVTTGDWVVVDTGSGYDIGKISLSGDLVRLQMKKRKVKSDRDINSILRHANAFEIEKLLENDEIEYNTLIRARAIAATLNLDMKLGSVEYQADRRKATFFYIADDRVDFRELVKLYAKEFKVKVEMRQIGIRQESSKIGGIGSCGRELCCSTWHTNFTSVTTEMVKYQNLSVNQSKLTGLCSRLKCCLNYELDIYLEALEDFPKNADVLYLETTEAYLVKLDIFKGIMYYMIKSEKERNKIYAVSKERVSEILDLNRKRIKPLEIGAMQTMNSESDDEIDFEDVTGQIELKNKQNNRRKKPNNRNRNNQNSDNNQNRSNNKPSHQNQQNRKNDKQVNDKQNNNRQSDQNRNKNLTDNKSTQHKQNKDQNLTKNNNQNKSDNKQNNTNTG